MLSFDCYGTLIDWESGLLAALKPVLAAHGVTIADEPLLELYARLESALEVPPYRSYREVLAGALEGLGRALGFTPREEERGALAESLARWPAFPDTVAALAKLAERHRLVILSNVDEDLFAGSARTLEVRFAEVITAQAVQSYKPAPAHFEEARRRLGPGARWVHVAQSLYHDVAPARRLGLPCVWVNRRHGRPGAGATPPAAAVPDLEVPDLATLVRRLADAITR